jgi:predicted lipoprotein with Yx(FWY)xxD motif
VVQTASATVAGATKTVLTDSQGLTLYYRTTDSSTKVTCTGSCAVNWPPVLLPSGTPTGSSSLTGTLSVFAGPNGSQVLYNGHPLYRWFKDTAAGQTTGQGIGGFIVATPDLPVSS